MINTVFSECPLSKLLDQIGGKWKLLILYNLKENEVLRYGELQRKMPTISQKVLTSQLRDLEKTNFINRKVYKQIPPKVEYILTKKGLLLYPVLDSLAQWAAKNE